jgi:uncharacterized membrane-anchored protein
VANANNGFTLPADHPMRRRLNDEVHARPPERISAPTRVSFVALLADEAQRAQAWNVVSRVASAAGATPPAPDALHYSADLGAYRVKAERHAEFLRIKIIAPGFGRGGAVDPFLESAIESAGASWLGELKGETISAIHAAIAPAADWPPKPPRLAESLAERELLVGALISDARGAAFTDFVIGDDGFSRLLILDNGMTAGQAGRNLQRLVEIEAYRMLALLAFPLARARMGELSALENDLRDATAALVSAREEEEPALLERLTRLAAAMENLQSASQFRFAAAASYYELVERRLEELREARLEGLPTFSEFFDRRLAPAMRTCRVVVERQETLSARIARATDLLSTRVEISSQRQSHALLDSMDRRAQLQLRLQETVEGLSVAAITYYIVSLVGKAAEGLDAEGFKVDPALAMGAAIPVVALLVALGVWRIRRSVAKAFEKSH